MAKYRVEAKLTCLSDDTKWKPYVIEFDTEVDTRWTVRDRFKSIQAVLMRPIRRRENLPNPDNFPLTGEGLNEEFETVLGALPE